MSEIGDGLDVGALSKRTRFEYITPARLDVGTSTNSDGFVRFHDLDLDIPSNCLIRDFEPLVRALMMTPRIVCIYQELLRAGRPSDIQGMSKYLRLALEYYFASTARTTLRAECIDVDKLFTT